MNFTDEKIVNTINVLPGNIETKIERTVRTWEDGKRGTICTVYTCTRKSDNEKIILDICGSGYLPGRRDNAYLCVPGKR